jgi:ubiquitin C-terminal hydrolase
MSESRDSNLRRIRRDISNDNDNDDNDEYSFFVSPPSSFSPAPKRRNSIEERQKLFVTSDDVSSNQVGDDDDDPVDDEKKKNDRVIVVVDDAVETQKLPQFANEGNTCFQNATLQALFASPAFSRAFDRQYSLTFGASINTDSLARHIRTVGDVVALGVRMAKLGYQCGLGWARALSAGDEEFNDGRQHDAHEYCVALLDSLAMRMPELATVFTGQGESVVRCEACGFRATPVKIEFTTISLDVVVPLSSSSTFSTLSSTPPPPPTPPPTPSSLVVDLLVYVSWLSNPVRVRDSSDKTLLDVGLVPPSNSDTMALALTRGPMLVQTFDPAKASLKLLVDASQELALAVVEKTNDDDDDTIRLCAFVSVIHRVVKLSSSVETTGGCRLRRLWAMHISRSTKEFYGFPSLVAVCETNTGNVNSGGVGNAVRRLGLAWAEKELLLLRQRSSSSPEKLAFLEKCTVICDALCSPENGDEDMDDWLVAFCWPPAQSICDLSFVSIDVAGRTVPECVRDRSGMCPTTIDWKSQPRRLASSSSSTSSLSRSATMVVPPVHVDQSLRSFFATEEDVEGWRCDQCKCTDKGRKSSVVVRFPPVLILHWKRFATINDDSVGMFRSKKLRDAVVFRQEETFFDQRYRLVSVVDHAGSIELGHYTTRVRHSSMSSKWLTLNDSSLSDCANVPAAATDDNDTTSVVGDRSAYLLVYERIDQL